MVAVMKAALQPCVSMAHFHNPLHSPGTPPKSSLQMDRSTRYAVQAALAVDCDHASHRVMSGKDENRTPSRAADIVQLYPSGLLAKRRGQARCETKKFQGRLLVDNGARMCKMCFGQVGEGQAAVEEVPMPAAASKCPFAFLVKGFSSFTGVTNAAQAAGCPFFASGQAEGEGTSGRMEGSEDFVNQMRVAAMDHHTKDVGGTLPVPEKPFTTWRPTRQNYLQFLADHKAIYDALGIVLREAKFPSYALLRGLGMNRHVQMEADFAAFAALGIQMPAPAQNALDYAAYLQEVAEKSAPGFLCHWYNLHFAQAHGGRMLGRKYSALIPERPNMELYQYNGELPKMMQEAKLCINSIAKTWSSEEKEECMAETERSFEFSWGILQHVAV